MLLSLFAFLASADPPKLDAPPDCESAQAALKAKGRKATYTGSCREDVSFTQAPRPNDIVKTLDAARAALDACVMNGNSSINYRIDLRVEVWRDGLDKNIVYIVDSSEEDIGRAAHPTAGCIATIVQKLVFPLPIVHVNRPDIWTILPGYAFSWHYAKGHSP